jgi:hypothetical protein
MGSRKGAVVRVVVMTRRTQRGCPKGGQRCPEKAIYEKGGLFSKSEIRRHRSSKRVDTPGKAGLKMANGRMTN